MAGQTIQIQTASGKQFSAYLATQKQEKDLVWCFVRKSLG